jgi:hypothetical protein
MRSTAGNFFALNVNREWYPGWGSNPHDALASGDFKSPAYAIPPPGPGTAKLSYQIAYDNMSRMEMWRGLVERTDCYLFEAD